jgi:hypothetical protein
MDGNAVDGASLVGQECHIVAKEPDGHAVTHYLHQSNVTSMTTSYYSAIFITN